MHRMVVLKSYSRNSMVHKIFAMTVTEFGEFHHYFLFHRLNMDSLSTSSMLMKLILP